MHGGIVMTDKIHFGLQYDYTVQPREGEMSGGGRGQKEMMMVLDQIK